MITARGAPAATLGVSRRPVGDLATFHRPVYLAPMPHDPLRARLLSFLLAIVLLAGSDVARAVGSGEALYMRYCASCHGIDGRGDGPVATVLRTPPPNLARLSYSENELMKQIDGRRMIRAHGTSAMPVWGEVFEQSLIEEPHRRRTTLQSVQALADYVLRLRAGATEAAPSPAR